jgi:stringent starvation protein B
MQHPAQRTVESLHAEGATPRLHVNLNCPGAICPDFVQEKWQEKLVIDLDPSYPLNLEFTEVGIEADLSFGGFVTRCTFPWASIYVVANRATGKGIVIEENMPESVRPQRQPAPAIRFNDEGPSSGKTKRAPGESRRKRRKRAETEEQDSPPEAAPAAALRPLEANEEEELPTRDVEAPKSEELAQKRRSAFRVIDGGE